MYVLNNELVHCEDWVPGEIFIGGVGVAHGYYNDEERSDAQFIAHPNSGEKLFRTGDLGRVRSGLIEILGRKDSQVKVNGFRIELGEIEKSLNSHSNVQSSVIVVHRNNLCAYLVLNHVPVDEKALKSELAEWCRKNLTNYMVPRYFVFLESIPLSANGKVLRDKLASPIEELTQPKESIANMSQLYRKVQSIFCSVLRISSVESIEESFFSIGGTSVSAIQLLFKIQSNFGVKLSVSELFENPSISGIASMVEQKHGSIEQEIRSKRFQMKYYNISQGLSSEVMVLINPAGASGLCYMELSKALRRFTIYVIDDDFVASGTDFAYSDINEVVEEAIRVLKVLVDEHKLTSVALGGWSYGGVVAYLMTRYLQISQSEYPNVKFLVTFDAPIVGRDSSPVDPPVSRLSFSVDHDGDEQISNRAKEHFDKCTALLNDFHSSDNQSPNFLLSAPFVEMRAETASLHDDQPPSKSVISSYHVKHTTPGDHWTMLFGSNVNKLSEILNDFMFNHFAS